MATTLNGWTVQETLPPGRFVAPNGKTVYCRSDDVAVIFAYIAERWHKEVEPLPQATYNEWPNERKGYIVIHAYRPPGANVGVGSISNHHSGTGMDINGQWHPYERTVQGAYNDGFTQAQRDKVREICNSVTDNLGRPVVRTGLDFDRGWRDGMHVEIDDPSYPKRGLATAERVRQAANKIRSRNQPAPTPKPTISATQAKALESLGLTADQAGVKRYQQAAGLVVDGILGPNTSTALEKDMDKLNELDEKVGKIASQVDSLATVILGKSEHPHVEDKMVPTYAWWKGAGVRTLENRQALSRVEAKLEGLGQAVGALLTAVSKGEKFTPAQFQQAAEEGFLRAIERVETQSTATVNIKVNRNDAEIQESP